MDARKIQFLIGIQRAIDKLEAKDGNTPKVEKVKSRFYDVVEVEEMMGKEVTEYEFEKIITEKVESEDELNIIEESMAKDTQISDRTKYSLHHPKYVVNFLKKFRNVNDTGLRDLMHPPYDEENFNLNETLDKINNELFPSEYDKIKTVFKDRLPFFLWAHIRKDLVNVYERHGKYFWKNTHQHPLFKDEVLTRKVIEFSKSIRFGRDRTADTSFREDLIPKILIELKQETNQIWLDESSFEFQPDVQKFDANMVVMNDVIRVKVAIKIFLRLINQKSNWHGESVNQDNVCMKRLVFAAHFQRDHNKELITVLTITDVGSWCNNHPDYLFNSGDLQGVIQNLWSLCEWEIIARFSDGLTYRLDMLNSKNQTDNIIEQSEEVSGFTHRLTFYH